MNGKFVCANRVDCSSMMQQPLITPDSCPNRHHCGLFFESMTDEMQRLVEQFDYLTLSQKILEARKYSNRYLHLNVPPQYIDNPSANQDFFQL